MIRLTNNFTQSFTMIFLIICFFGCLKKNNIKSDINVIKRVNEVKNITIFVHGTHTYLLTKLFRQTLFIPNRLIKILNLNQFSYIKWFVEKIYTADPDNFPLDLFYAIGWSGKLSSYERYNAAKDLYYELLHLKNDIISSGFEPKITIIAHSHGCNVALNLAKVQSDLLPEYKIKINRLITIACPIQDETEDFIKDEIFEKIYSIYSTADMFQILDLDFQGYQANKSIFSRRRFKQIDKLKQAKIKINNRSISHIEFIFWNFPKFIPAIIKQMDLMPNDSIEHAILIKSKKGYIKNIEYE